MIRMGQLQGRMSSVPRSAYPSYGREEHRTQRHCNDGPRREVNTQRTAQVPMVCDPARTVIVWLFEMPSLTS